MHCLNGVWIFAEMSPFIKKNTTSQFSSREREEKLLDKIEQAASPDRKHAARTLFSVILDISKQLQSRILAKMEIDPIFPVPNFSAAQKIGCQGTNGANSETASQQFFPGRAVTFYPTFEHVFQAVERGEVDLGCCLFIIVPAVRSHQHTTCLESTIAILLP